MNSIIVLDSDSEDEAPSKKTRISRSIPATITAIKPTKSPSVAVNATDMKLATKTRAVPSGITITRQNQQTITPATANVLKEQSPTTGGGAVSAKPQVPKVSTAFQLVNRANAERHTPTPPKSTITIISDGYTAQVPALLIRKRKTPTPPQPQRSGVSTPPLRNRVSTPPQRSTTQVTPTAGAALANASNCSNSGNNNNNISSAASSVGPLISSVQSMTASSTPPLQLLATPPPQTSNTMFSDPLMINPHLMHTNLPESTTITLQSPTNSHYHNIINNNNNNSTNNNNNTNDFKIHLPSKSNISSKTPSPAASPITKTPPPPSPSPTIVLKQNTNPNHIQSSSSCSNTSNRVSNNNSINNDKTMRRIKPTTLLKNNDEAWLKRGQPQQQQSSFNESPFKVHTSLSSKMNANTSPKNKAKGTPELFDLTEMSEKSIHSVITLDDSPKCLRNYRIPAKTANSGEITETKLNGEINANECTATPIATTSATCENAETDFMPSNSKANEHENESRLPLESDYEELISTCRKADVSADMEKLIETKLIRYYHDVHPSFVQSRGFRKNVRAVTLMIKTNPDMVYYNLKTIVDELKVRRKVRVEEPNTTEESNSPNGNNITSTGNKRTDEQIKKLNKALYILNKRIVKLEEAEVDWEDEDSTYVQMERFKKRACQIYEKICDLTGESKYAHRLAKKPISFTGTAIPQFNRTLQAYINRTREFPDYYDVLHMLEHCNRQYDLGLVNFEMNRIAQDAFLKVGKLLQARRRNDLYETVTHFTANTKDPATLDAELMAKLSENQKQQTKVSDIINKYANLTPEELKAEEEAAAAKNAQKNDEQSPEVAMENGNDDDDDDDDEDEDMNTFGDDVDRWTNGVGTVDLSDVESDTEFNIKESPTVENEVKQELLWGAEKDNIMTQSAASDKTEITVITTTTTTTNTTNTNTKPSSTTTTDTIPTLKTKIKREKETTTTAPASTTTITATNAGNCGAATKAVTPTRTPTTTAAETKKMCDKTVNSNKQTRIKTGDEKPPQPNGKLKEQPTANTMPNLRIVSVTSLQVQGAVGIDDNSKELTEVARNMLTPIKAVKSIQRSTPPLTANISSSSNSSSTSTATVSKATSIAATAISTKTAAASTTTASSITKTQKQRTVMEIVISDEES